MKDVRITVVRMAEYKDLMDIYENPIENACDMTLGNVYISKNAECPKGLCQSAWESMEGFVRSLANGEGNFYGNWMKDPYSAMISCNDGFRPVSFYIEAVSEEE